MKVKRKVLKSIRAALVDGMKKIVAEHACDGCCTDSGNHELHCKYTQAVLLLNAILHR